MRWEESLCSILKRTIQYSNQKSVTEETDRSMEEHREPKTRPPKYSNIPIFDKDGQSNSMVERQSFSQMCCHK